MNPTRLLMVLAVCPLAGCASATMTMSRQPSAPVSKTTLSMASTGKGKHQMTGEQEQNFRKILAARLKEGGIELAASAPHSLHGAIHNFEPGSQVGRWFWPGLGAGHFDSEWTVKDASGNVVGEAKIAGSISAGFFGGSFDEVLGRVGERLAEFLRGQRAPTK